MLDKIKTEDLKKVVGGVSNNHQDAYNSVEFYVLLFFDFTYNIEDPNINKDLYNRTVKELNNNGYEVIDYKLYKDGILITREAAIKAFEDKWGK